MPLPRATEARTKAAAAGRYERLEQADLVEMMEREPPSSYDVVTAADETTSSTMAKVAQVAQPLPGEVE